MEFQVCSVFSQLSLLEPLIAAAYRALLGWFWLVSIAVGALIPLVLANEGLRRGFRLFVILVIWLGLFIFLSGHLLAECLYSTTPPGITFLLLSTPICVGFGLIVAIVFTRLFGPSIERFVDWLTGRSRHRQDGLSDIRAVDEEIPNRPRDFDPREFIEGDET